MERPKEELLANDETEGLGTLFRLRLPWLVIGLIGGALIAYFISRYESLLAERVSLAYFIPVIVYLSDAVGTQTEAIMIRNLARGRVKLATYLSKEIALGLIFGGLFGSATGIIALVMFNQADTAWTVATATLATIASATVVATISTFLIYQEHQDPAVGAGPLTTIIQDAIAILIYFGIASWTIFS
ncbi:MAG: magnesium transporter [Patescibacteria group bacterium]